MPKDYNRFKRFCKRGHELIGDNLYVRKSGKRECKVCKNDNQNMRRKKEKQDNLSSFVSF